MKTGGKMVLSGRRGMYGVAKLSTTRPEQNKMKSPKMHQRNMNKKRTRPASKMKKGKMKEEERVWLCRSVGRDGTEGVCNRARRSRCRGGRSQTARGMRVSASFRDREESHSRLVPKFLAYQDLCWFWGRDQERFAERGLGQGWLQTAGDPW